MKYMRERERGGKNVFYLRLMKPIFDEWAWILPLHKKIQFISSSRRVIFFLLYCLNAKSGKWRHRYLHQWEYGKYVTVYFRIKHSHLYNKLFSLIISWLVRFLLFSSGSISRIDSLRGSLTASARSYTLQLHALTNNTFVNLTNHDINRLYTSISGYMLFRS